MVANVYLEGTYSEYYANISQDEKGLQRLFKQFSFPGGIPSHVAAETPGLDQRGRRARLLALPCLWGGVRQPRPHRLLRHRRRRGRNRGSRRLLAFEQVPEPRQRRRRAADPPSERIQDRQPHHPRPNQAETSWPTTYAGCGYKPYFVEGDDPATVHQLMAATLDHVFDEIKQIQRVARVEGVVERPRWPMIVLVTPKGWTGPKRSTDCRPKAHSASHQVPFADMTEEHIAAARRVDAQLQARGALRRGRDRSARVGGACTKGKRRMGDNPHANGGAPIRT